MIDDNTGRTEPIAATQEPVAPAPLAVPVLEYATPSAYDPGVWRCKSYVVVNAGSDLPDRCVRCNGVPAVRVPWKFRREWNLKVTFGKPWRWPFIREPATTLHVGLCRWHAFTWRAVQIFMGLLILGGEGLICLTIYWSASRFNPLSLGDWIGTGFIAAIMLFVAYCYFFFHKPLRFGKRDNNGIWIRFAGTRFRESLLPLELPRHGWPSLPTPHGIARQLGRVVRHLLTSRGSQ